MIGQLYTPPPSCLPSATTPDMPKDVITQALPMLTVKIKNSPVNFQVRAKEISLYYNVLNNPALSDIAGVKPTQQQPDRFHSLGMAVTAVYNLSPHNQAKASADKLCAPYPRHPTLPCQQDPAMGQRGESFIAGFCHAETPLDSTHYAQALGIGHRLQANQIDEETIDTFSVLWQMREQLAARQDWQA